MSLSLRASTPTRPTSLHLLEQVRSHHLLLPVDMSGDADQRIRCLGSNDIPIDVLDTREGQATAAAGCVPHERGVRAGRSGSRYGRGLWQDGRHGRSRTRRTGNVQEERAREVLLDGGAVRVAMFNKQLDQQLQRKRKSAHRPAYRYTSHRNDRQHTLPHAKNKLTTAYMNHR